MNDKTVQALSLPAEDIDKLIACADGDCALLYLHIVRTGGFSASRAAGELRMSERAVSLAADKLRRLGLMPGERYLPSDELPQYTAQDIASRADADPSFAQLVTETQRALGRMLSSNDLRILFGIYDHLGLPAEVVLLLINHCIERAQAQSGPGRLPAMRAIEKEAWFWAEREIVTLDAAEEHIRREKERAGLVESVKEALQIRSRALTPTERRYVDSWLEMGFSPECIAIAYDRTVVGTGRLTWKYMDKILHSWSEKRLFTPQDIERGDSRAPRRGDAVAQPTAAQQGGEIDAMRRLYERMNKGE